ncbi:MAG: hypothetical protein HKN82_11020, partial [Akkermansiaceae bacterium]|nr:hypothetical protein [Akkermansiaceae bacterium]
PIFEDLFDLGNGGESLRLDKPNPNTLGPDILLERVRYNDKAPWPTEADGAGPSLERFVLIGYGNEPLNWRAAALAGSPGRAGNFAEGIAIGRNSSWDYKVTASTLAPEWPDIDYNATSWDGGPGVLGYGETFLATVIPFGPDPLDRYPTTYFRKPFVVNDDPAQITSLTLSLLDDDGVVVYLNGKEVVRRSLPAGPILYSTLATEKEAIAYEDIDLTAFTACLVQGGNVLAVEVHQADPASNDLVWDAGLVYSTVVGPVDSDGDGMTDDWETANGLNPDDPSDASLDRDADGQDNLAEFVAGTDPNDPASVLRIGGVAAEPDGSWRLQWASVPGKTYRVSYSPNLSSWFGFGALGDVVATGSTSEFTDPSSPPAAVRYYRVEVISAP